MNKSEIFLNYLDELFPNVSCELEYQTDIQLLISVVLSAQTTDKAVNKVTDKMYHDNPSVCDLEKLTVEDIEEYIRRLGLYKNKSKNVYLLVRDIIDKFDGKVPDNYDDLVSLPGVGRKTANVVLTELFEVPAIAVDTHVERVSKRLKFAYLSDSVLVVEKKLMKKFPRNKWIKLHHQLIHFGRYFCKARNPNCSECKMTEHCRNKNGIIKY